MKLPQKQTSKRPLLIVSILTVLLLIGSSLYYWFGWRAAHPQTPAVTTRPTNSVDYNPPSEAEKQETEKQKEEIISDEEKNTPPSVDASLHVSIARVTYVKDQSLSIRTVVTGTTSGECTVTLSQSGQSTISKKFPVSFEATSSTCKGIDIAASEFPVGGNWDIQVIVIKDGAQSSPATSSVNIVK